MNGEKIKDITEWEVLTPSGWQDFEGIKKVTKDSSLKISYITPQNIVKSLICSKGHQLFVKRFNEQMFMFAEMLEIGTDEILFEDNKTYCKILDIVEQQEEIDLYDLINVKNGYEYIANNVVNHNCAHVEGIDELWLGLQPTMACVAGDTLILTNEGFLKIEDFHKNKKIGDYFPLEIPVYGKQGLELTSHGYVSPDNDTIIVTTKHGHQVEVTPIHPLYTLQNNGIGKMIQTKNLKLGDFLRIEVNQKCFGKTKLHEDLAYMLGGYIAEGWITKRKNKKTNEIKFDSIEIENSDYDFRNVFLTSQILEKNFRPTPSRQTRLRCSSKKLVNQFIELGINPNQYCFNKTTPKSILQGDKKTIANYLSGLFDGDGSISSNVISLSSTSEKLIRETSMLLHNFGFVSNITPVKKRIKDIGRIMPQGKPLKSLRDSWKLTIPRSQYKKFYDEIGFRIKRKNDLLKTCSEAFIQNDRKLYTIPVVKVEKQVKDILKKINKPNTWFRENNLRLDKFLSKNNSKRFINKNWLEKYKNLAEQNIILNNEEKEFFNENIGSFYWDEIVSLEKSFNRTYDFTVPETHTFLQNGILGSNTGGAAILISSPSGVGTLFHKIWVDANTDKNEKSEGKNGFYPIELPWTVHPDRDIVWFEKQRAELVSSVGERAVNQELLCSFQSSGDTFIKGDIMDHIFNSIRPPQNIQMFGRDEIWLWDPPKPGVKYILSADVARGDGDDYSAFNLINTQTSEIVADFKGKPPPDKFAELLITYGTLYNNALICQELNNVGVAAAIKLKDSKYSNLYYEKFMKNMYMSYMTQDVGDELPGFTTNANTRVEILAKLENVIRNKQIHIYSKRMFQELQTFIWKGNKPQAQKGYHDDLTMSLAIGCQLYEASSAMGNYNNVDLAMSMLKGMSRESKSMNAVTGEQKTQTYQASFGNSGPISTEFNKVLETIKQNNQQQNEIKKKTPHNLLYGPYKWVLDD